MNINISAASGALLWTQRLAGREDGVIWIGLHSECNFTHLILSSSDHLREVFLEPRCLSSLWCWRLMLNEHINLRRFRSARGAAGGGGGRHGHSGRGFPANCVSRKLSTFHRHSLVEPPGALVASRCDSSCKRWQEHTMKYQKIEC